MDFCGTRYGYALRLDPGEEVIESLTAFAGRQGLYAGLISGLGAVDDVELGFFSTRTRSYTRRRFEGDHEIGSLTGNLSKLDGQPFVHCHMVLSGADYAAWTGHVFKAVVSVTAEIQILTDPAEWSRLRQPARGFNPLVWGETP